VAASRGQAAWRIRAELPWVPRPPADDRRAVHTYSGSERDASAFRAWLQRVIEQADASVVEGLILDDDDGSVAGAGGGAAAREEL